MFTLPSLTTVKYAALGAGALAAIAGGFYAGYRWERGDLEALRAANARELALAEDAATKDQAKRDKITLASAIAGAKAQTVIVDHYHTITKEIPAHVPDSPVCVPYGLVRVLNAAAGPAAHAVPDATAQPDDACAPISWRSIAADLAADYQAGAQNAQQLTDLQGWVQDQAASRK